MGRAAMYGYISYELKNKVIFESNLFAITLVSQVGYSSKIQEIDDIDLVLELIAQQGKR
jgi:hypothetical protein